jgi:hypothetical protein
MMPEPIVSEQPSFPTETEIYILPDGQVIVADLPAELAAALAILLAPASPLPDVAPPLDPATSICPPL